MPFGQDYTHLSHKAVEYDYFYLLHLYELLLHVQEAVLIKQESHRVWLRYNPLQTPTCDLIKRITTTHTIKDLVVENPPIEEIIASFYRDCNL